MASQLLSVRGKKRTPYGARGALQAKIARLPQTMEAQQQRELIARDTKFQNKQMKLQKDEAAQRRREQEVGMGLEAGKLGLNIGMSDMGKKSVGDLFTGGKKLINDVSKPIAGKDVMNVAPKSGGPWDVNVGSGVASGLTGYGVGKLVGGKNKKKKAGFGAGAGALMGMLSSKPGSGLMGGLIGGLTGGLGGYFS